MRNVVLPNRPAVDRLAVDRPATRRAAILAAVATASTLAAALFAPTGSAAEPARSANLAACPAATLVAWLDTDGNGAAGTIFYALHFTNLSGHRCTVRGYPGVSPASPSGRQIGPGATRSGMAAHPVTLNNGAGTSANLGIVEAGNFPPTRCRPATAAGLRVFAPGATLARFVPFPFAVCTRVSSLRISPVGAR